MRTSLLASGSLLVGALLSGCACSPPANASVPGVQPVLQEATMWCWAASAQMVLGALGDHVRQCDVVNKRKLTQVECCPPNQANTSPLSTPTPCNQGAFPDFAALGYTSNSTVDAALSWDQVRTQISCRQQPFPFSWHEAGGSGHMMVAIEYQTVGTSRTVCLNDPSPDNPGYRCIPYDQYVDGERTGDSHWNDYYNFAKKP
jgi:hypothetical protein